MTDGLLAGALRRLRTAFERKGPTFARRRFGELRLGKREGRKVKVFPAWVPAGD
jgi:hypothetical protein